MSIGIKNTLLFFLLIVLLLSSLLLAGLYIGYTITLVCSVSLTALIASIVLGRKEIEQELSKYTSRYSLIMLSAIVLFFIIFSFFFMKKTELIFFDEQIYQSMALNILNHGNALTCVYGSGYLRECYLNSISFDPNGWPFLIAIAFKLLGVGASTAYLTELFFGAMSIIAVFLLSSVLTSRKEVSVLSAAIFALIPELFIWSRTIANPNVPFMFFATLTVFFFVLFAKKGTKLTFCMSLFGLVITSYLRVDALLLLPIFAVIFFTFGENGARDAFRKAYEAD